MARKSSAKRSSRKRKSTYSGRRTGKSASKSISFYAGPRSAFEKKFIDTSVTVDCNNGGAVGGQFFVCAQGNTPNQRIGNKITVTNINIRGYVSAGTVNTAIGGAADEAPLFRIICLLDKQSNGAAPSAFGVADGVLQPQNYAGNTQWNILQFRNMFNLDRFVILKDKIVRSSISSLGTSASTRIDQPVPFKFSWKGMLPVMYNDPAANLAAVRSNNFVICVISDKTMAASTANANFEMCCRVKFIDA